MSTLRYELHQSAGHFWGCPYIQRVGMVITTFSILHPQEQYTANWNWPESEAGISNTTKKVKLIQLTQAKLRAAIFRHCSRLGFVISTHPTTTQTTIKFKQTPTLQDPANHLTILGTCSLR